MGCSTLVILSDAHLGPRAPGREAEFVAFLARVPALGDALLVNGDLWDFWFGYPAREHPSGARVLDALADLGRRLPVTLVGGNHDRWGTGHAWATRRGLAWAPREAQLSVGGRRVLARHGDGLATPRRERFKHALLGHPATHAAFGWLPPAVGFAMVGALRGLLAGAADAAAYDAEHARQRAWVAATLPALADVDLLVLGHSHRADAWEVSAGRWHVNPGAWCDGARYALVTADAVTLHRG